jgi:endonuclease-3
MYRMKAKNIKALAAALISDHGGAVPDDYDALVALPGVGRKTANVVLAVGFGRQRVAVDTHVFRVANRIGFCDEKDVLKTELALTRKLPPDRLTEAHHSLIFHGRGRCRARRPSCEACPVSGYCAYAAGQGPRARDGGGHDG